LDFNETTVEFVFIASYMVYFAKNIYREKAIWSLYKHIVFVFNIESYFSWFLFKY